MSVMDIKDRVEDTKAMLLEACRDQKMLVTVDGRVSELAATTLLGFAPGSLKGLRKLGGSPPFYLRPAGGGRVSYRLQDLAVWLEQGRQDW